MKELLLDVKSTASIYDTPGEDATFGLLAEYPHPGALMNAARGVREAGYRRFDTYSPFPIHGMDAAMGMTGSKVGWGTFFGGLAGLSLAMWLQWWTGAVDYPLNISGKPEFAIEPSVPIAFELTILLAALTTVAVMLALNGLPRPWNPLFSSKHIHRATDDGFFLFVAATDPKYNGAETGALLEGLGATRLEPIRDDARGIPDGAEPAVIPVKRVND
jgi:hypothetical protein